MSSPVDLDAPLRRDIPRRGPQRWAGSPRSVPGVRRARSARRSLRWRMAAAPLVAAVVVGFSAVELARSPVARPAARPAGEATGPTAELQPPRGPATEAAEAVPPPRPAPEAQIAAGPSDVELLTVAGDAVAAWGRFAGTGDLAEVADQYVTDGPQYAQFAAEAPARQAEAGGPPYRFTLTEAAVLGDQPAGDRLVRGTLELTREGQPAQRFRWDLRLRRVADGTWRVWTVLDSAA